MVRENLRSGRSLSLQCKFQERTVLFSEWLNFLDGVVGKTIDH